MLCVLHKMVTVIGVVPFRLPYLKEEVCKLRLPYLKEEVCKLRLPYLKEEVCKLRLPYLKKEVLTQTALFKGRGV